MSDILRDQPLIVIVGTTASGKTHLGVELAKLVNGEVICADSRTIYKGLDIGTAKPDTEEMQGIRHWGLDLVKPDDRFTVADFKKYADAKIREIQSCGKIPILVGGSGLYIDSVIYNYKFDNVIESDHKAILEKQFKIRKQFSGKRVDELRAYIHHSDISMPENSRNPRYLVRAIEKHVVDKNTTNDRDKIRANTIIFGIKMDKKVIRDRIKLRVSSMFSNPVFETEAQEAFKKYAPKFLENIENSKWSISDFYKNGVARRDFLKLPEALKSNIYLYKILETNGIITKIKAEELAAIDDWHLAKKQTTWFSRNSSISWLSAEQLLEIFKNYHKD